jgi:hypothetical protein
MSPLPYQPARGRATAPSRNRASDPPGNAASRALELVRSGGLDGGRETLAARRKEKRAVPEPDAPSECRVAWIGAGSSSALLFTEAGADGNRSHAAGRLPLVPMRGEALRRRGKQGAAERKAAVPQ